MIIEKKVKNYTVFVKKDGEKYIEIFKDFLSYNHQVIKVFRNIEDTKVVLINTDYGKYILKVFSPKVKNTERFFKSLVKGDYYEKLFHQTDRVRREGFAALNDFYLLAEIKTLRYVKTYVMIIEYIEGIELVDMPEISDEVRGKIKQSIYSLHQHGMVSGDPHKGNVITKAPMMANKMAPTPINFHWRFSIAHSAPTMSTANHAPRDRVPRIKKR